MEFSKVRNYLTNKTESEECFPFGDKVHVYKLKEKMFALLMKYQERDIITFKLKPDEGFFFRDIFEDFIGGYHFNKKHWNTVFLDGDVPDNDIEIFIDKSFQLIFNKLKKSDKLELNKKYPEIFKLP